MSRSQVITTTLSQQEQREFAHVIAAIVATQNRHDYQLNPNQVFLESLKNALMQATPLGTNPRIIDGSRGVYLDEVSADHLSETLKLLRSDNIVTTLNLRLGDDEELMRALDLSALPASITTISVRFKNPEMAVEFWEKMEGLLASNATLTDIDTLKTNPVPEVIQGRLTWNKEHSGMSLAAVPNPIEQKARAMLFGELALTSRQRSELGADAMRQLTVGNTHKIVEHTEEIQAVKTSLIGVNRRLDNAQDRLNVVEANQQGIGDLLMRLARKSSAISDSELTEYSEVLSGLLHTINLNSEGKAAATVPDTEAEQYIRDFKFLFHSVLLHGQVKNMADLNTVGGVDTEAGVNAAKMFGSLGRIAGKFVESLPFGAAAGAMVGAVAKVATDRVERGFWKNIVQLSNDGDNAYIDVLSASLAERYANHRFEPVERSTALGAIGNFINYVIGQSVSTGRIRSVNPKAADDIKHLFSEISRYTNLTIHPDARTMAVALYQIKHPQAAVNDNRGMKYSSTQEVVSVSGRVGVMRSAVKETGVRFPQGLKAGSSARTNVSQKGSSSVSVISDGGNIIAQENCVEKREVVTKSSVTLPRPHDVLVGSKQVGPVSSVHAEGSASSNQASGERILSPQDKARAVFLRKVTKGEVSKSVETKVRWLFDKKKVAQDAVQKLLQKYSMESRFVTSSLDDLKIYTTILNDYIDEQINKDPAQEEREIQLFLQKVSRGEVSLQVAEKVGMLQSQVSRDEAAVQKLLKTNGMESRIVVSSLARLDVCKTRLNDYIEEQIKKTQSSDQGILSQHMSASIQTSSVTSGLASGGKATSDQTHVERMLSRQEQARQALLHQMESDSLIRIKKDVKLLQESIASSEDGVRSLLLTHSMESAEVISRQDHINRCKSSINHHLDNYIDERSHSKAPAAKPTIFSRLFG